MCGADTECGLNCRWLVQVGVLDEVQMLADPGRGWGWTRVLLGMQVRACVLVCELSLPSSLRVDVSGCWWAGRWACRSNISHAYHAWAACLFLLPMA